MSAHATAKIVSLAKPAPDSRAALLAEREAVAASVQGAERKLARLAQAQAAEEAAVVAIGALGRREIEAVKLWAASGCEGPQPQPDHAERHRLGDAFAQATRANDLARSASQDIEAEIDAARRRIMAIDAALRLEVLGSIERVYSARVAKFNELADRLCDMLPDIHGLHRGLIETGRTATARGDADLGRVIYQTAERMAGARLKEIALEPAMANTAVERWVARIQSGEIQ